ncbi:t holin lysis mediator [Acinetobacter phage Acj61]|jgi:hypothetical protein|uniref:Holin n=1 Tax=Acinetobacter phage Acj61 TaxID=760732 RepID=E5E4L5_9CAUD|nr:holin [Acinetobacter phage Acj61]ADG36199.1 t holin lysis mediator [Acinetobacter phage Acj61]
MSTDNNQTPEQKNTGIPVFDFIFGLLDRIFKDNATGKILASRVVVLIVLFAMGIIWTKGDQYLALYKESRYETYAAIMQKDKDARFETVALEQLQIVHVSSGADFSAVYSFRPKNFNYFVDLIAYEGQLPASVDPKNLGGFPIDKTSNEYSKHLSGSSFSSENEFKYLPTTDHEVGVKYMYSCPYFNMDNVYSGTVAMYWFSKPVHSEEKLSAICGQAVRALGRAR